MTISVVLRHSFPGFLLDVAFEAPPGVTVLFGRSGSGKTTVVNAVAGLMQPQHGRVVIGGQVLVDTQAGVSLPTHRRRMGYVFQEARLFAHLSVRQNLLYGRWFSAPEPAGTIDSVVDLLGLGPLMQRRPSALSGGEKQRVAIGRALLSNPKMLLMDEPLASLDDARKAEVLPFLERLRDQAGVPILYVSHAISEVARLATTLVVLEAGRVAHCGPAQAILADPSAVPALGIREAGAVITARIVAQEADALTRLETSAGPLFLPRIEAPVGSELRIRISAQDVMLSLGRPENLSALNILPATVAAVRIGDGPGAMVQLLAGSDLILARITRRSATGLGLAPGVAVFVVLKSVSVAQSNVGTG